MCEAKWVIVVIGVAAVIVIIMSTSIYFSSGGNKEFNLGEGNNVANVKESTGIHLIEVDASNNDGWSWLEIGFVVLALKLGLLISHAFHYFYLTKHLVKNKVVKAVDNATQNVAAPVNNVPGVLVIPALPFLVTRSSFCVYSKTIIKCKKIRI